MEGGQQKEQIKRIFKQCDKNGDGDISLEELGTLLKSLGRFQNNEIKAIFTKMDKNNDGLIQYDEFVDWIFGSSKVDAKAKVAMMSKEQDTGYQMAFFNFCAVGQSELDGKSFAKLCKEAGLFDKNFSQGDAGIVFTKAVGKGATKVSLENFENVLKVVAEKKGADVEVVRAAITACGRPQTSGNGRPQTKGSSPPGSPKGGRPLSRAGVVASSGSVVGFFPTGAATGGAAPAKGAGAAGEEASFTNVVRDVFKGFSGSRPDMDCDTFLKMLDYSMLLGDKLLGGDKLSDKEATAIFNQVSAQSQSRISFRQFESALRKILEKLRMEPSTLEEALRSGNARSKHDDDEEGMGAMSSMMGPCISRGSAAGEMEMHRAASCLAAPVGFLETHKDGKSRGGFSSKLGRITSYTALARPGSKSQGRDFGDKNGSPHYRERAHTHALGSSKSGPDLRMPSSKTTSLDNNVSERAVGIFSTFCSGGSGADIDGKGFAKFCKDSGLLCKFFTAADVDIVFAEVVGPYRKMGAQHFEEALKKIAGRKKTDVHNVELLILGCNGPSNTGTVADYVRLHDDFIDRPHAQTVAAKANLR